MHDQISSGMNRLPALLGWWGLSSYEDRGSIAQQFIRLQNFVAEVQEAYLDATGRYMDAIFASNDRLARSAYDIVNGGKQSDLSAAQAEIVSVVLEAAAQHARTWAEFQQQVKEIYSTITRAPADKAADGPGPAKQVKDKPGSSQPASETLVDAA